MICPRNSIDSFVSECNSLGLMNESDGSIQYDSSEWRGVEIKTKPLGFNVMLRTMSKFAQIADKRGIEVNKSTGYHIHISNKRFFIAKNLKKILSTWIAIEDVLMATQPQSRMNNQYCKRRLKDFAEKCGLPNLPAGKEKLIDDARQADRYYTLNLNSLSKHGTLECRLHSGTVNFKKIKNWAVLITAIFDYALTKYDKAKIAELMSMNISELKIDKVWQLLDIPADIRNFYNERINKFLFPTLNTQQEAAVKIMAISPKLKREKKAYDKAELEYNKTSADVRRLRNCFGSTN